MFGELFDDVAGTADGIVLSMVPEMLRAKMGQDISEATRGNVTVRIHPSGELGAGPKRQYCRVITRGAISA